MRFARVPAAIRRFRIESGWYQMISMELLLMCFPLMEDRFLKDFL